jgi:perosamine synthetase
MASKQELALFGGTPAVREKLPVIEDRSGRDIGQEEMKLVTEVIESGSLNYLFGGTKVERFESEYATYYSVVCAVASSSGTAAIHVALNSFQINPGDEVIVPPITDGGTVIPILYQNAIPVFADIDPGTYSIDPAAIKKALTQKTKAIIVVHLLGHSCNMDPIMEIARQNDLWVVEDCSQAFLTEYKGRRAGTIGDVGCFSFQQSKHMTTGDGGMTITNRKELCERIRMCADKGWPRGDPFRDYLFLAPNYHMTEMQAAVGIAQLAKLASMIERRRDMASLLTSQISGVEGIAVPPIASWSNHTYWKYPLEIDCDALQVNVEEFGEALSAEGVPSWAGYIKKPLYLFEFLREKRTYGSTHCPFSCPLYGNDREYRKGLCPEAEALLHRLVVLHWSEKYTERHIAGIAEAIKKVARFYSAKNRA